MIHSSYGPKRPQHRNDVKRMSVKTQNLLHRDAMKLVYPHSRINIEVSPSKSQERSVERDIPFVKLSSNAQNNLIDKEVVSGFLKTSKCNVPKEKPKPNTANLVSRRKIIETKAEQRNSSSRIISTDAIKIANFYEGPTKIGLVDYDTTFGVSTPDDSFLAFGSNNETITNRNQRIGSELSKPSLTYIQDGADISSYDTQLHKNILSSKLRIQSSKIRINTRQN